jgi:hypothetical protein
MKKIIFFLALVSQTASATIWITLADPRSNKIAIVGASSGYIGDYRTMVSVDNYGLAAVGSWYLGKKQGPLKELLKRDELSAREKVEEFSRLINMDSMKRRVSLVTSHFENASEPGRGCHEENHYCGKFESKLFTVTGGGLVGENVILAARDELLKPEVHALPIECQLYRGIKAIFESGGEKKTFNRLSYMVDDVTVVNDVKHELFFRMGKETDLLKKFEASLKNQGLNCAL